MTSSPGRGKASRFDDSLRIKLQNGQRSEYSPRFKSSCASSQKLSLCLVSPLRSFSYILLLRTRKTARPRPLWKLPCNTWLCLSTVVVAKCLGEGERAREREATVVLREAVNQQETFWVGWTDRSPSRGGFSKMFKQSSLLCNRLVVTRCTRTMSCAVCDVTAETLNTHK